LKKIPKKFDSFPVNLEVTGKLYALQDASESPTTAKWPRPVPIGDSTGHSTVSAGAIGARMTDGFNVFALSNNHVFANINFSPIVVIASQAGMDGSDGGWVILYGLDPFAGSALNLVIDEDVANDEERNHVTEQGGYILFGDQQKY
jgi:hypothetical protein